MKKESDLWKLLKKNTPQIRWTRLESWSSFGVCDCLGYHDHCGFFMVELKLIKNESYLLTTSKTIPFTTT